MPPFPMKNDQPQGGASSLSNMLRNLRRVTSSSSGDTIPPHNQKHFSKSTTSSRSERESTVTHNVAQFPITPILSHDPLENPSTIERPSILLSMLKNRCQTSDNTLELVPLIEKLARSVLLFPFPPPGISANTLGQALQNQPEFHHPPSPIDCFPDEGFEAFPSPLQIYRSQSYLLVPDALPPVRCAVLGLLGACIESDRNSIQGLREIDKAVYWSEVRRWAMEAKVEERIGSDIRWVLPDQDREALVSVLFSLTNSGKELLDMPGLVSLLCTFIVESLPQPPPPSPLYDLSLTTPFTASVAPPARHASALSLLTSLHKFSAAHIYPSSTILTLKSALEISKLSEESYFWAPGDQGVLGLISVVVRHGEIAGDRLSSEGIDLTQDTDISGERMLHLVVSMVARIIGCEFLVGVFVDSGPSRLSYLPNQARKLMRDLIRSPANQALKSLRSGLVAPCGSDAEEPPLLLFVGSLKALRDAYSEHALEQESTETNSTNYGDTRWPSMLSLGLPFIWNNLKMLLKWKLDYVDAEILWLLEEHLSVSERRVRPLYTRLQQHATETITGITFEEWDMAVDVLGATSTHVLNWQHTHGRLWVWGDNSVLDEIDELTDEASINNNQFKRKSDILVAFSALLQRVFDAWTKPGFTGPHNRVFTLLLDLSPHLQDETAQAILDQCSIHDYCLPTQPNWIERIEKILGAFFTHTEFADDTTFSPTRSSQTRLKAFSLVSILHNDLVHFPTVRDTLHDFLVPYLENHFESESDVEVADVMLVTMVEIARDSLSSTSEEGQELFSRIRLLLFETIRRLIPTSTRSSSTSRRGANIVGLTRVDNASHKASICSETGFRSTHQESRDVSYPATISLITLFHICLVRSTPNASVHGISIFQDLLSLLVPNGSDAAVPIPTRLLILQWMVRLRADAAHRLYWERSVDISTPAGILGRVITAEPSGAAETLHAVKDDLPELRGRQRGKTENNLERSSSRRKGSSDGNAALRGSSLAPTLPMLWTYPENLPFDFGEDTRSLGGKGIITFDHNRYNGWTEEDDLGTGSCSPSTEASEFVVLPISEYLRALNHLLMIEPEWELVSYAICHLPDQLSNKYFASGPRTALEIRALRKTLCGGLRGGNGFLTSTILPTSVKKPAVNSVGYLCLTSLIAYRGLFTKAHQDEMVETFMYGLGNPRDTAKVCIHALAMASFELAPSLRKYLAEIMRQLQKIISSATLGVHILELIAGIGLQTSLCSNFTEVDFQTVFGIALKYIQEHNERLRDNPTAEAEQEGLEFAFSQYVFLLAYYAITTWFLMLRLADRPKYVDFLIKRLVAANINGVDEPTQVCFDMIVRYSYSNADPRPHRSMFDTIIAGDSPNQKSKSWIIGHSILSVSSLPSPAWVEVTVRRASGVIRMLWELQNINGVQSSTDQDSIAMYHRHRKAAMGQLQAVEPTEDSSLKPGLSSAVTSQLTLDSGLLTVDPSFFVLQLSSYPDITQSPPLPIPSDLSSQRSIASLDRIPIVDFHKIGVLYVGPNQTTETEILANMSGSKAYTSFITKLGALVRLKGSREKEVYTGGLDQENDIDGKWTYLWDDDISQIVFHIATLMPTVPTDPSSTLKKRHIGNDFTKIVFNESGSEFRFDTLPGDFNFVNIVIEPHLPAGTPWSSSGMVGNADFFRVTMQCRPGMPEVGPLGAFKVVTSTTLPDFVRQLALHSNIFAQVYLASVGFEARSGNQKMEYVSNWRKRLVQIKMLKQRVSDAQPAPSGAVQDEITGRRFTSWL